jgi:hypothetical protein
MPRAWVHGILLPVPTEPDLPKHRPRRAGVFVVGLTLLVVGLISFALELFVDSRALTVGGAVLLPGLVLALTGWRGY